MTKLNKYLVLITIFLIAIIVTASILAWSRYSPGQPVEISTASNEEWQGMVYIEGAISNPGSYPIKAQDSLQDIIQAAGGFTDNAEVSCLQVHVPRTGEGTQAQKIDLNRAEAWLLEALPGIGEVRAQAIIDYRSQNGPFHNINELTKVEGIGLATYEQITNLITVAD